MDDLAQFLRFLIPLCVAVLVLWYLNRKPKPKAPVRPSWTPPPPVPTAGASTAPAHRPPESLNLDLGQFAPMSDDQVRREAGSIGSLWGNAWFGRRDLIPPADDPRTRLIDRAMVAHGMITPEELLEIHQVGQEMDGIRPDLAQASVIAEQAVKQAVEDRQQIKERKKAEAAERKRQHDLAVAQRKATDIIYLGRGVSKLLGDRTSDGTKLQAVGLPVLSTPADIAEAMKLTIPRLRWLAFHSDAATVSHYIRFNVPKKSGGSRALFAPHDSLSQVQQWILENILEKIPAHPAAHGFVPQRGTITNASAHVGRAVVVNADLTDFFPTVTFPRVRGIFRQMGYSGAVATILALLCTESPRRMTTYNGKEFHVATGPRALPQGACTSPALSNLAARRLDSRLSGIAARLGWTYSRYADDLTFSCDDASKIGYLLARVRHIARDEGFAVNEKKTRVLRQSARQTVTGIVVNRRAGVPRRTVRRLRAILHRASAEGLSAQNRENHPHFEAWVRGMLAYVHMVSPQQAAPLIESFRSIRSG